MLATILEKKYTESDSDIELLRAIHVLASDKNERLFLSDCIEWLGIKMAEIDRLALILLDKQP